MSHQQKLQELRELVAVMRELGIVSHNGTILTLAPPEKREEKAKRETDPLATRRARYEEQLGRPVSDEELKNYP